MNSGFSVVDLLELDDWTVRALRAGPDCLVLIRMSRPVDRGGMDRISRVIEGIADRLGIDREQVVCLEPGASIETLTHEQLAAHGLQRLPGWMP